MIIWIASYPKSGNTWLKLFLSAYLGNHKDPNTFDINKMMIPFSLFPTNSLIKKFDIDYSNFNNLSKHWLPMQEYLNVTNSKIFVKTHNAMCTINGNPFTNSKQSLGAIYLVRDPRDVVMSYSDHLQKTHEDVVKNLLNSDTFEEGIINNIKYNFTLLGSWGDHYNSWKNYKGINVLIIKYEDLINNTFLTFEKIIKYLSSITKISVNETRINECIEITKFDNLKNIEQKYGFNERGYGKYFFRIGKIGDWKTKLDKKLVKKIEKKFYKEMIELGYLN
tara:strand:- start:444 stop:1277 length:834 start_codon:yes stop_codon:yes gene_type:complete